MRIIIIDDDKLVRMSLKTIIEATHEVEVMAIGENGKEAIELFEMHFPDIILMDIRMAGMTGLEAGKILIEKYPDVKILFLTTFADDEYIVTALKIGAKGYILKQHFESIVPALKAVEEGHSVFGDEIISKIPTIMSEEKAKKSPETYGILDKEIEIITLVAEGLSNKEISSKLFLSEGTIRNYISIILEKLCLRDRTQLAIFYFNNLA